MGVLLALSVPGHAQAAGARLTRHAAAAGV